MSGTEGGGPSGSPASIFTPRGELPLLLGIERELRATIAPALSGAAALASLRLIQDVLADLCGRRAAAARVERIDVSAREQALAALAAILEARGDGPIDATTQSDAVVTRLLDRLAGGAGGVSSAMRDGLDQVIADLSVAAQAARAAMIETAEAPVSAAEGSPSDTPPPLDAPTLEEALQSHCGLADVRVARLASPPEGYGKITLIADLEGAGLPWRSIVVRQDTAAGATATSVAQEYPLLAALHREGLPVPEPLCLGRTAEPHGSPFMLMSRVAGVTAGNIRGPFLGCSRETLLTLARFAARLHSLDPVAIGLPPPWTAAPDRIEVAERVRATARRYREAAAIPSPIVVAAFAWLEENVPEPPSRPVIVHSDLGLWNIMMEEDRLTGVLDWELAKLGDPMEDLAYMRAQAEQRMAWNEFVAAYLEAGGAEYRPEAERYYAVLKSARNAMFTEVIHRGVATAALGELRMGHAVLTCLPPLEAETAAALLAAQAGRG